jgi:hypothetical protein
MFHFVQETCVIVAYRRPKTLPISADCGLRFSPHQAIPSSICMAWPASFARSAPRV